MKANITPRKVLDWNTPWHLVMGKHARVHRIRTFGSLAHVVRPADMHKAKVHTLGPVATKCILLEAAHYKPGHHIYRIDGRPSSVTQDLVIRDFCTTRSEPPLCIQEKGIITKYKGGIHTAEAYKNVPQYLHNIIQAADGFDYGDITSLHDDEWHATNQYPIQIHAGMHIARQFTEGTTTTWYTGEVTGIYIDRSGTRQYVIEYEDDDTEDLDRHEYMNYLLLWGRAIVQQTPGVPAFPPNMYEADINVHGSPTDLTAKDLITELENVTPEEEIVPDEKVYEADDIQTPVHVPNSDDDIAESSEEEIIDRTSTNIQPPPLVRRSARTRRERTIYDPSPASDGTPEAKDDGKAQTDNEATNQVFFIQTSKYEELQMEEFDGVFTLDGDNKIIESVVRGAPTNTRPIYARPPPETAYSAKGVNYRQAMKSDHAPEYKDAADAEIAQLNSIDVFRYCSVAEMRKIDPLAKPILLGWVLVRKLDAVTGQLIKTKGRIYRRGDLEEPEVNYDPTKIHSSNVHLDAVKVLLAMAATYKLEIISMDVSGAFLRSRPTRLTFVKLPHGYKVYDKNNREMVAICTRALYGGKDCGRSWEDDRNSTILEQTWIRSLADGNIFRTVAVISGGDAFSKQIDITYDKFGNPEHNGREKISGETEEQCLKRVKAHLESIETSYQKREDWLKNQETSEQRETQLERKRKQQWQNQRRSRVYTANRSDDVQGNGGHHIPRGEEFPELHRFDEEQLCSSLPTNDTPGIMFANMAVFTDDILIVTNNRKFGMLMAEGFMKVHPGKIDERPASFLGLGIEYGEEGELILTQRNLIKEMMEEGNMSKCAPAHTPIATPINKDERPEDDSEKAKKALNDINTYMRVVGQAIWLRQTRPDLIYATSQWARVSSNPGLPHHAAIKRGVRYLSGTRNLGTTYGKFKYTNDEPYVICDANHDETCVSGMVAVYGGAVVAGRSWVQTGAQLHSFAAEKVALTDATKMACWIKDLAMDLGAPVKGGIVIYDDNQALIKCVKNENTSSKTRHLRIRMAWVKQMIREERVEVRYVNSQENISDALTKPLTRIPFVTCREQMLGNEPIAIRMRDLTDRAAEAKEVQAAKVRMGNEAEEGAEDRRCYCMKGEDEQGRLIEKHERRRIRRHANRRAWEDWSEMREPTGCRRRQENPVEALANKIRNMQIDRGRGPNKRQQLRDKMRREGRSRRYIDRAERKVAKSRAEKRAKERMRKLSDREWSGYRKVTEE